MVKIIFLIILFQTIIKLTSCIEVEGNSKDKQLLLLDNKYREKEVIGLENILFANNEDVINRGLGKLKEGSVCKENNKIELDIIWESQLASTISNTPLIVDLFGTGDKQIIITNSHTYIDVINGIDGDRLIGGWPYILPDSSFATSPLVYDIDGNGDLDIMVTTTDAEILFIDSKKVIAIKEKTLKVPPLKVKKLWYDGLDGKHVDASFSLYNKDNQKYQIQKQMKENQEFEETQKKEYQINGGDQSNKFQILKQQPQGEPIDIENNNNPLYSILYDKYLQDNKWFSRKTNDYIWVDSHILSTPVIADIDGDGINELVVSVSYYYDPEKYENPYYKSQLDDGVSVENYIAGGISVFNLATGEIKWQTHLDLTTDKTDFKGLVYGSPTVVDLNNDGKLEIIIGTALGFLYVLDYQGVPLTGNYPLVLESIFTQIITEDLDSDGKLELIVIDTKGNVVCFSPDGDEIWSQQVTGKTEFPPSIGDLDGDGVLDVVMSTFTTGIFAWNGKTGKALQGYPLKFEPSIISPLLLLETNSNNDGLTIFVHANDGILYTINDNGKCIGRLDIGDFSITKILTNDLTTDGNLNLLLSTFDQKVYCLSIISDGTNVKFNPLKVENSFNINGNKFSSYSKSTPMGVLITQPTTGGGSIDLHYNYQYSRNSIDISGSDFNLEILILDQKNISSSTIEIKKKYTISVYFGEIRLKKEIYYSTGLKQLLINIPPSVSRSDVKLLTVKLENINSQLYQDSIPISFNFYFYRFLKFLIILPILISTILLLIYQSNNLKSKNIKKNSLL
ncbi:hypothetical protein ACTA71_009760 [Dictyostelium dimigraforme]